VPGGRELTGAVSSSSTSSTSTSLTSNGTLVTVRDLYYPMSVRRRMLIQQSRQHADHIRRRLTRISLLYYQIHITLIDQATATR
jgi:DNA mismatch repair ATPase MutL